MHFCLRIDLDYVPWDTPDAEEFGHGEPAVFMRLLDFAKANGLRFHFFASTRVVRAFPATAEAVLNEGHHLDWLCKHPEELERWEEANVAFESIGHLPKGIALRNDWPANTKFPETELEFICSRNPAPIELKFFEVTLPDLRDYLHEGKTYQSWLQRAKDADNVPVQIVHVRPQVLSFVDPKLTSLSRFIQSRTVPRTLRELLDLK